MTVATATPTDNNPCKGGPGRSADCVTEWISSSAFCASEVQGMTNRYCAVDKNIRVDYKSLTTNTPHCVWDMETSFDSGFCFHSQFAHLLAVKWVHFGYFARLQSSSHHTWPAVPSPPPPYASTLLCSTREPTQMTQLTAKQAPKLWPINSDSAMYAKVST